MPLQPVKVTDVIPAIKNGIFPCRFDDISEETNDQGTYWLWNFMFQVPEAKIGDPAQYTANEDGYALIPVTSTTSARITPRTKAAKWIEALRGSPVEVDEEIDFGTMFGMYALGVIEVADNGYSRVQSLLPANTDPTLAPAVMASADPVAE